MSDEVFHNRFRRDDYDWGADVNAGEISIHKLTVSGVKSRRTTARGPYVERANLISIKSRQAGLESIDPRLYPARLTQDNFDLTG